MAYRWEQKKYMINDKEIWQPDEDLSYDFATTFTEDSTRDMSGVGHFTPLFTVEQNGYSAKHIPICEVKKILKMIVGGKPFTLYYFSPYYGEWRTDWFYVGQGNLTVGSVEADRENISQLSFNMTGINPIVR